MENKEQKLPENEKQQETSKTNGRECSETISSELVEYSSDMLEGMTLEEREAFFEENGKSIGDMDFEKKLTDEELAVMKDEIYRLNDELLETTEEKAAITK